MLLCCADQDADKCKCSERGASIAAGAALLHYTPIDLMDWLTSSPRLRPHVAH